jgi:hypothetical protein
MSIGSISIMEEKNDYTVLPQTVEATCDRLMIHLTQEAVKVQVTLCAALYE